MAKRTLEKHVSSRPSTSAAVINKTETPNHSQGVDSNLPDISTHSSPVVNDIQQNVSEIANSPHEQIKRKNGNHDSIQERNSDASLLEFVSEFPDTSKYIGHSAFSFFVKVWREFRSVKMRAKHPKNRPNALKRLQQLSLSIPRVLFSIVKSSDNDEDLESQSRPMFSALRKLKDHIEVTQQIIQIVENGRTLLNQTPAESITPLRKAAKEINAEITEVLSPDYKLDTTNGQSNFSSFYKKFDELNPEEISNAVLSSFNLIPRQPSELHNESMDIDSNGSSNTNSYVENITPSQFDSRINSHDEQVTKNIEDDSKINSYIWIQERIPGYSTEIQVENFQSSKPNTNENRQIEPHNTNNQAEDKKGYTHNIVPSMILSRNNTTEFDQLNIQNISLYQIPSDTAQQKPLTENADVYLALDDEQESNSKTEDDDEYIDEDIDFEDDDVLSDESPKKHRRIAKGRVTKAKLSSCKYSRGLINSKKDKQNRSKSRPTRRTATSYDSETTHYLKSVFFDKYSENDKLTKEQRKQVQKDTGLKPRNITYWFSNHKRRFRHALSIYRKTVKESNGNIQCYDDFIAWRVSKGLPEDVMEWED